MTSPKAPKDKIFEKVINPYLTEVLQHPQSVEMREGMLHIRDVEGPKKTGSMETRLEAMEQQVFMCQGMVERGLTANHMMIRNSPTSTGLMPMTLGSTSPGSMTGLINSRSRSMTCRSKTVRATLEHLHSLSNVEPSIAIIKDFLSDNVDGHDIHFIEDAARIAKPHARDKHRPVVGTPVVSAKIGDHCYHGLCDVGASVSAIPQSLYDEIKDEIAPIEMEPIDVTIQLANRDTICPLGIVRDVEVLCGKMKYLADFLVLATTQDTFCPIIFGRPFLNTVDAHIDCEKQIVTVGFEGVSHEFNFSMFGRQPHKKQLPSKDEIISQASMIVPRTDPLEQYLLEHENDMHMDERDEIDRVIFEQYPILKNNLPVELLGELPPPKGDPLF
ncbi:hypothetical protein ZWY2020_019915 [Hordeum vulgare]|nr:hypothetical protein ZWY2020_019915 [Hordeum vulgare]